VAEIWGAAIAAAGAAYGAYEQGEAADAAARGARQRAALSQHQFEQMRSDLLPFTLSGQRAVQQMDALNAGDFSRFYESPDYQFTREQAIRALDRSAAARGTQFSGGQLAALAERGAGLARQSYGDYYNRLAQLAGLGQNAAAMTGNAGMTAASQIGQGLQDAAKFQAAGRLGQASTYANLGEQLAGAFGRWYENRNAQQS
jgi:hypothetical protein